MPKSPEMPSMGEDSKDNQQKAGWEEQGFSSKQEEEETRKIFNIPPGNKLRKVDSFGPPVRTPEIIDAEGIDNTLEAAGLVGGSVEERLDKLPQYKVSDFLSEYGTREKKVEDLFDEAVVAEDYNIINHVVVALGEKKSNVKKPFVVNGKNKKVVVGFGGHYIVRD